MTNSILTLRDLQGVAYQRAQEVGKFPANYEASRIGYFYWYGKLTEELWERWYWNREDVKLGNTRFYRERVRVALTEMLRCWLLGRVILGYGSLDFTAMPLRTGTHVPPIMAAIGLLSKPGVFDQDIESFFGAVASVCHHTKIKYSEVLLSLTKGEGE